LRVSSLPTVHGEKLVMRIVDKSKKIPTLDMLGIVGKNRVLIEK
jgi:type II secretory ATPase GspE/PulE/Tfp pilus assembly ATPase PilB-like protein